MGDPVGGALSQDLADDVEDPAHLLRYFHVPAPVVDLRPHRVAAIRGDYVVVPSATLTASRQAAHRNRFSRGPPQDTHAPGAGTTPGSASTGTPGRPAPDQSRIC